MAGTLAQRDQENLIHSHQAAAASKPLNQGIHGLAPKTPGAKVPTRVPAIGRATGRRNNEDENVPYRAGKTGNAQKNAFVTPSAPHDQRAPLGAKTTNAKAKAFQTPAQPPKSTLQQPQQKSQQRTTARKPKLKIHQQSTPAEAEAPFTFKPSKARSAKTDTAAEPANDNDVEEESEPEIEYCPPKPVELPDEPDFPELEFTEDRKFPQFEPQNYFRGVFQRYREKVDPIGEDGLTRSQRQTKEKEEQWEKRMDKKLARRAEKAWDLDWDVMQDPGTESESEQPGKDQSKKAARALSGTASKPASQTKKAPGPSRFAAPTAASKAKNTTQLPSAAKPVSHKMPGTAASRSTIGYAQGRKVSSTLKDAKGRSAGSAQGTGRPETAKKEKEDDILGELLGQEGEDQDPLNVEEYNKALCFENGVNSIDDLFREPDLSEVLLEVPKFDA